MCYDLFFLVRRLTKIAYRYAKSFTHSDFNIQIGEFQTTLPPFPKVLTQEEIPVIQNTLLEKIGNVILNTYYKLSGFDHQVMPIICYSGIYYSYWGLIPRWATEIFWDKTLNARSEDAYTKPSFKHLMEKNRCIIPVSGFFETRHTEIGKFPYKIWSPDNEIMSLAGLWDEWRHPESGEMIRTFTILTTDANPLMMQIHNSRKRMPVIIAPEDEARWLDPNLSKDEVMALMQPYSGKLSAHTISQDANSKDIKKKNQPSILDPVDFGIPELIF